MKTAFIIIRWVLGIFLCLLSIGGFATGDTGAAIFVLVLGLIILPPITNVFLKRKVKLAITSGCQTTEFKKTTSALNSPQTQRPSLNWLRNWFTGWGTAIKVARALDSSIKRFPELDPKKIETLLNTKQRWSAKEAEFIRQRLINSYDKKITPDNVDSLGLKYLDFYQTIFPDHDGREIIQKINMNKVEGFILLKVNNDEALDPIEINEIIEYSNSLNVSEFNTKEKIRDEYDYYITNWELDNGIYKGLPSDFVLQKNELCIYRNSSCELLEKKTITRRVNYSGASYRIKITKGFSYRLGSYNVASQKETVDVSKGRGLVNVTTKRIMFKGSEGVTTINTSAIVDIEPYKDAVVISKSTGKPLTIRTQDAIKLYQYIRAATRH